MTEQLGDVDAMLEVTQALLGDDADAIVREISRIVEKWDNEEEIEEEPFNPESKVMWEVSEVLPCTRTYFIPAHSAAGALEFFNSGNNGLLDDSDMWELFSDQEDEIDGNEVEPAKCLGRAGAYVRYINEEGIEAPRE